MKATKTAKLVTGLKNKGSQFALIGLICLSMAASLFVSFSGDLFQIGLLALMLLCSLSFFPFEMEVSDTPLLLLMLGTIAFGRSFSLLAVNVKGIPLYVTEMAIAASVLLLFVKKWKTLWRDWTVPLPSGLAVAIAVYFGLGVLYTAVGVMGNGSVAFRDIVFCLYSVLLFIALSLLNGKEKLRVFFRFLLPAVGVLLFICSVLFFFRIPAERAFRQAVLDVKMPNIGLYCGLIVIAGFSFYTLVRKQRKLILGLVIYLAFLFVLMAEVRAAWVGLLVAFIFLGILLKKEFKIFFLIFVLIVVSFFIIDYFDLGVQKNKLSSLQEKVSSVTRGGEGTMPAANIKFRLNLWKQTWHEIKEYPVFGWGYGIQIDYVIWRKPVSLLRAMGNLTGPVPPHNHLMAITYKMGFFGLLLFLFINARIFFYGLSHVKKCRSEFDRRLLIALLAGVIYWHGMAFFFDILESPPTGIFLWIMLGAILAIIHKEQKPLNLKNQKMVTPNQTFLPRFFQKAGRRRQ
ncbi:MAG: O-antigen ligase family protein [Candidatus Omnitrophota bacterium]